jgi:EipB-like
VKKKMKTLATIIISVLFALPVEAQQAHRAAQEAAKIKSSAAVNIMPHRAYYSVKMESAKKDSTVKDTSGRMIIELTHDCDGWTLKQESASVVELASAPSETMRSEYMAKESDDGKNLQFRTQRVFNETTQDSVEGEALFTESGGTISYTAPETASIAMKEGTLPPIMHLKKLIQKAKDGEQSYSTQVFDGSFYGNPVQIDAFISGNKGSCKLTQKDCDVSPMNLAVYAMPSTNANPNFEIKQDMDRTNGVMRGYVIDFGDYTVKGTLDKVEFLPSNACGKKLIK